jgi:hypothetical protein
VHRTRNRPITAAVGLLATVALLAAGCGDDDTAAGDGEAAGAEETADEVPRSTTTIGNEPEGGSSGQVPDDPCSLLETSEIGQQFSGQGAVEAGRPLGVTSCGWPIGNTVSAVMVGVWDAPTDQPFEDFVVELLPLINFDPEAERNPSEVAVAGTEPGSALYEANMGSLWVHSGDTVFWLATRFHDDDPGAQDKLIALAELVVGRL